LGSDRLPIQFNKQLGFLDKKFQSQSLILTNRELKIGWEAREIFDRYNTEIHLKILR
jgi:hypothetical protein